MNAPPITLTPTSIRIGSYSAQCSGSISSFIEALGPEYEFYERTSFDDVMGVFVWPLLGIASEALRTAPDSYAVSSISIWFDPYDASDIGGPSHIHVRPRTQPITIGACTVSRSTTPDALMSGTSIFNWTTAAVWLHDNLGDKDLTDHRAKLASPHWKPISWETKSDGNQECSNQIFFIHSEGSYRGSSLGVGLNVVTYSLRHTRAPANELGSAKRCPDITSSPASPKSVFWDESYRMLIRWFWTRGISVLFALCLLIASLIVIYVAFR